MNEHADKLEPVARLKWLPRRLHPPAPVPLRHERLLLLVGVAALIADYDVTLYGLAAEQIRQDLNVPEEQVTLIVAIFRLGIFPAIALAYCADIIGRRLLLMVTLAGAAAATVLTAFATDIVTFTAAQTLARMFIYAEELLCVVVIAEEFHERTRGWAVGAIGALASLGAGLAALAFAAVPVLPYGWRALYFLGAIPLLWLLWARRSLPETQRFAAGRRTSGTMSQRWLRPAIGLLTHYPLRLAILALVILPFAFGQASSVILLSKYLQTSHGWAPWMVSSLVIGGGLIAVIGNFAAGLLSDRVGRKTVIAVSIMAYTVSFWLFYAVLDGWALVPAWIVGIFSVLSVAAILSALGAELFPTSYRAVASGVRLMCWLLGGSVGLLAEGQLYLQFGNHPEAVAMLLLACPLALIPLIFLPETAARSLEAVSPEKA